MNTKLARISQLSKENPDMKFDSIGHLINVEMLKACHHKMDGSKAVGVDGTKKADFEENLEENIDKIITRLRNKSYGARI